MDSILILPVIDKIARELRNWELEGIDDEEGYLEIARFLV